jgi:K+ transport systems, NAD-binding component
MNKHIAVINTPKFNPDKYFERFASQIRENRATKKTPIVLINTDYPNGLPSSLVNLGVHLVEGHGNHESDFKQANLAAAEHILVLAKDEFELDSDSLAFDLCYRMKEHGLAYRTIVECVEDENRDRLKRIGVKSVIRPIRSYPEILVRAMETPGAEVLIEDMFTRADDHFLRFPLWLEGDQWRDVVTAMISANMGTPLAYVSKEGKVCNHPAGEEKIYGQSIIMLVRTNSIPSDAQVSEAFRSYHSHQLTA